MNLKKLFVVTLGVTSGAVLSLAAVVATWAWWADRPKSRDASSIAAVYEGPIVRTLEDGRRHLSFRYRLRNTSKRDVSIPGSSATLYVQRADGSLIDIAEINETQPVDINVPAGETVIYFVAPQLPYKESDLCSAHYTEDPTQEQLLEYVAACYDWLGGFVLISDYSNLKIGMSFSTRPLESAGAEN